MLQTKSLRQPYDMLCKIIVVGDTGVGKTNILLRYTENYHKTSHVSTLGVDFTFKTINVKGTRIKMQLWDTAGQCRFKNITKTYFLGSSAIIFVYSIDDLKSFKNIHEWILQADENSDHENQIRILLANKIDLADEERKVSKEEGEELAKKFNMIFS